MTARLIVVAAALALCACGDKDGTKKSNNDGGANNGTDLAGDMGSGLDTGGTADTGGMDVGSDLSTPDGGPDDTNGMDVGSDAGDSCGNGTIEAPEGCDDGALNDDQGNGTCRENCQPAACGDGVIDWRLQETCDDGNVVAMDGCSATCTLEVPATCGDGTVDAGEACDDGGRNSDRNPDACRTDCSAATCGDSVTDTADECDDGNLRDGDGCSANCTVEAGAGCGDGVLDQASGEECDDGNTAAGDGCSATCQLEAPGRTCGDGTVDATEVCDDSNNQNGDGCNPTCNLRGNVTTLLTGVSGPGGLAADRDRVWVSQDFQIGYIALDAACLAQGTCVFTPTGGDGTRGHLDDADGANAQIGFVEAMATDGTTVWFFDARTLRSMSTSAPYAVSTVAGDNTAAPNNCEVVDGVGAAAGFYGTRGLTYYGGLLYFLDGCTGVLRQFDPVTAEVRTIAGTQWQPSGPAPPMCPMGAPGGYSCNPGAPVDGFGAAGAMVSPRYMASDNGGMLYITDTNGETIRTYNTVTGYLGTLAGGTQGYVDGVGTMAQLDRPRGLTSDGTSLYWSEQNEQTVRQLVVPGAVVTTLAGQRGCAGSADGLGGTGQTTNCNAGPMGRARFNTPFNIVYHFPSGSLYVRDGNGVRRID